MDDESSTCPFESFNLLGKLLEFVHTMARVTLSADPVKSTVF